MRHSGSQSKIVRTRRVIRRLSVVRLFPYSGMTFVQLFSILSQYDLRLGHQLLETSSILVTKSRGFHVEIRWIHVIDEFLTSHFSLGYRRQYRVDSTPSLSVWFTLIDTDIDSVTTYRIQNRWSTSTSIWIKFIALVQYPHRYRRQFYLNPVSVLLLKIVIWHRS